MSKHLLVYLYTTFKDAFPEIKIKSNLSLTEAIRSSEVSKWNTTLICKIKIYSNYNYAENNYYINN